MRILEEFWYGNIEPTEYDTSSKEYKKLQELICRNEEKLRATMTDEQKELFEKYTDCVRENQVIEECLIFQNGFKLGARMMLEVMEGRCDIGLSSRDLKAEEKEAGLSGTVLAYDGIAVIVNPENPVSDLSVETIAKIYTGEITNWAEVGGNDVEIVLIGREAGSGTRDGFESITDTEDACKYRQELTSTGDVITTVSQNPGAIGYASVASVKDTVKAVTVDGAAPTEATIKDGSYVIQRPFVLVTKSDAELSEAAQKFFDYITSSDANEIIAAAGVVSAN